MMAWGNEGETFFSKEVAIEALFFGDYIIQDKESMHKNFIQSGLPPYLASHSRTHKHNSGLVLQLQILVHEL